LPRCPVCAVCAGGASCEHALAATATRPGASTDASAYANEDRFPMIRAFLEINACLLRSSQYAASADFTTIPAAFGVPDQSVMIDGKVQPETYQAHADHETWCASAYAISVES